MVTWYLRGPERILLGVRNSQVSIWRFCHMHAGNVQTRQNSLYRPNQGINMAQLGPYQPPIHTHYGKWPHKYDILGFCSTVKRKRVVSLLKPPAEMFKKPGDLRVFLERQRI